MFRTSVAPIDRSIIRNQLIGLIFSILASAILANNQPINVTDPDDFVLLQI